MTCRTLVSVETNSTASKELPQALTRITCTHSSSPCWSPTPAPSAWRIGVWLTHDPVRPLVTAPRNPPTGVPGRGRGGLGCPVRARGQFREHEGVYSMFAEGWHDVAGELLSVRRATCGSRSARHRGSSRPRTDHRSIGHLRVRVRSVALPGHQSRCRAHPEGSRVLRVMAAGPASARARKDGSPKPIGSGRGPYVDRGSSP